VALPSDRDPWTWVPRPTDARLATAQSSVPNHRRPSRDAVVVPSDGTGSPGPSRRGRECVRLLDGETPVVAVVSPVSARHSTLAAVRRTGGLRGPRVPAARPSASRALTPLAVGAVPGLPVPPVGSPTRQAAVALPRPRCPSRRTPPARVGGYRGRRPANLCRNPTDDPVGCGCPSECPVQARVRQRRSRPAAQHLSPSAAAVILTAIPTLPAPAPASPGNGSLGSASDSTMDRGPLSR